MTANGLCEVCREKTCDMVKSWEPKNRHERRHAAKEKRKGRLWEPRS